MQHIRTKWHKIMPLIDADEVYLTAPPGGTAKPASDYGLDAKQLRHFLTQIEELPHFVMDRELIDLASDHEYQKSILDMKRANVMHLPYPAMIVEWPSKSIRSHTISLIRDMKQEGVYPWESGIGNAADVDFYTLSFHVHEDAEGAYFVISAAVIYLTIEGRNGEPWINISPGEHGCFKPNEAVIKLIGETYRKEAGSGFFAVTSALLLMATAGITKEVIETERVNKQRKASGKTLIPKHTYIRIGHVYRSARSTESDEYNSRRSPRPHWRRGHLKTVRHGVGHAQVKEVFIKARLVAFHGETTGPRKPEYVVTE